MKSDSALFFGMAILPETVFDAADIEDLLDLAFGEARYGRTVYRMRNGIPPVSELCFVSRSGDGVLRASLRFWRVEAGKTPLLLLGPLAVRPGSRRMGYGKGLVWHGLAEATRLGHGAVILAGQPDYYAQFGFEAAPVSGLSMPGPIVPHTLLGKELTPGALKAATGQIRVISPD